MTTSDEQWRRLEFCMAEIEATLWRVKVERDPRAAAAAVLRTLEQVSPALRALASEMIERGLKPGK